MALRGLHRTIRFRITAAAVLAVAVVLVATAVGLVAVQRNQLNANLDRALEQRLELLSNQLRVGGVPEELAGASDDDRFAEILVDGSIAVSTARPDDDPYRTATATIETDDGQVEIVVGEVVDDIDESVGVLRNSLAVAIPVVLILLGGLVWWLVGRTLRPVEAIRSEVAEIGAKQLDHRVTEPTTGDEVAALGRTMNEMLERIDTSVKRQQRFVADASHELRSPLTRIRTQLEVDAARPETAELAVTHESVLEETVALQDTVDDLLYLARADSAAVSRNEEHLDLDDVVTAEAERIAAETGVTVDLSRVSAASVLGDRSRLRRAVRNLLSNAARHAQSEVTVELGESDQSAILAVGDDGPGIPPEQRALVFERFTRLDEARASEAGGTGLGLAITQEIVAAHGGTIELGESTAGGARFVVTLPAPAP